MSLLPLLLAPVKHYMKGVFGAFLNDSSLQKNTCPSFFVIVFPLQLRREKIDLENTLEQEQEALVNRLWKRMDKLEAEKRFVL